MDMFTHYQNIDPTYQPNNLSRAFCTPRSYTKLDPVEASKPYELYDAKGNLEGYFWYYKNVVNLDFMIDGVVTIEDDDIVFHARQEEPQITTKAIPGQKAYNIYDFRSWTCIGVTDEGYLWEEDIEFTFPADGDKDVYVSAETYLKDKYADITLYDFRYNVVTKKTMKAATTLNFTIDTELSKKLVAGCYYCSLEVYNNDMHETIFAPQDCKLVVR